MDAPHLIVFGLGYTGTAIAMAAVGAGFVVTATSRTPASHVTLWGQTCLAFDEADEALGEATHVVTTVPVAEAGDPVLLRHGAALENAPRLRWAGYLSTTGVYGDHGGGWVDEDTPPKPGSERTRRRRAAELAWGRLADRLAVDLFRVAGIYGPGRSAFDALRDGTAHRILKPGHQFGRIHRDDIAAAVLAAMRQDRPPGIRVLNLADDEPAEGAVVTAEAARLLGMEPPPTIPFAEAFPAMSPMARGFWSENRKVASRKTQEWLGLRWRYPTYREGLRAILATELVEQGGERPAEQG